MKNLLIVALVGLLVLAFVFSCGKKEESQPETEPAVEESPAPVDTTTMDTMEIMDTTEVDTSGSHNE